MSTFKVGDKVRVKPGYDSYAFKEGDVFTVVDLKNTLGVYLNGGTEWWSNLRFELVNDPKSGDRVKVEFEGEFVRVNSAIKGLAMVQTPQGLVDAPLDSVIVTEPAKPKLPTRVGAIIRYNGNPFGDIDRVLTKNGWVNLFTGRSAGSIQATADKYGFTVLFEGV